MPKRNGCQARQYSDQMYCPKCRITWDVNDPNPPECHDTAPGPYFVSAIDGPRTYIMAGPYETHAEALVGVLRTP